MTPKMCDKSVDTCPFMFDSVPDQYKTQEMCYKAVCFSTNIKIYYWLVCYE